ncbi:hypothetical protein O988_09778 [Pseudogymnoascus sp. VKM F-3808]|nr:hypothetical protein O988_09778 [Pseudogymnoascus sp. VKM F-3808]
MEDVDMAEDLKEESTMLEPKTNAVSEGLGDGEMCDKVPVTQATDKGKDTEAKDAPAASPATIAERSMTQTKQSRKMKTLFREMRRMSEDLNYAYKARSGEQSEVVKDTVEEINRSSIDGSEPARPDTGNVDDLLKCITEEAQSIVASYPGVGVENPEGGIQEQELPPLVKTLEDVALGLYRWTPSETREDYTLTASEPKLDLPALAKKFHSEGTGGLAAKYRDLELEWLSKEQSKLRKCDKILVVDFANFAENKAAYHKTKAAEEAGPSREPPPEPDLKHFMNGPQLAEFERKREKKRKADARKLRAQSEGGRVKKPPVSDGRKSRGKSEGGGVKQPPVKSMVPPETGASNEPQVRDPVTCGYGPPSETAEVQEAQGAQGAQGSHGTQGDQRAPGAPGAQGGQRAQGGDSDSDRARRSKWYCC